MTSHKEDVATKGQGTPEHKVVQLYDSLRPSLYRYLINIGVPPQDVEEIVQEAFLRLYQHVRNFGNEDNLRGWIYQVAHNLSVNLRKSRKHLVDMPPELWEQLSGSTADCNPGAEEQMLKREQLARIHRGLGKLTELQQHCLSLRVEGFRYREIAEILHVSISTVAGSLRNAVTNLTKECS